VRLDSRGRLQFLGRQDGQVKIRDFRVELEEIRSAILLYPEIADAVIMVTGAEGAEKQLAAACVTASGELDVTSLVKFISSRLPSYMIPALWTVVRELPITANGKFDRRELLKPARPTAAFL
jgi:acyl-coenzyme A synthetase/AMP-(fatty) acid ligase